MRNTDDPRFRDYFPDYSDKELQKMGRTLNRELMVRVVQRGEDLHSRACMRIRCTLDDLETTVAFRKFYGIRRTP
jgi:hypothetical protein